LGVEEGMTAETEAKLREALEPVKESKYFENEIDYLESVSFVETEGILTSEEAEVLNTKHLEAKIAVAESLREDVDARFETIENRIFRDVDQKDIQAEIVSLDNEYRIIDS